LIGPFLDYYIDPEAGFHLQFAAGLAVVSLNRDDGGRFPTEDIAGNGTFGVLVGTGYEVFVSRELALGLLGTAQFSAGKLRSRETGELGNIAAMAFGALLSMSHH
jgi:hypothetical protein